MYTNTSKFRVNGKYGLFTIPKEILNELRWNPGDTVGFWGIDNGQVIHIEKINSKNLKKEDEKYNRKVYKNIAKFGGKTGTCGIKSLPEFLMREFKPKNGQMIYFLPARYTWYREHYPQYVLNNILFATFNPDYLKKYEENEKENVKEQERKIFQDLYRPPFFKGKSELTEANTIRARNKVKTLNIKANLDGIRGKEDLIEKNKGWIKKIESSVHPQKKKIIGDLKRTIKYLKLKIKALEKNPEKIFKEWKQ